MDSSERRVLVICYGNLCRSPMAEVLLRSQLDDEQWAVSSVGTHALPGQPAALLAEEVLKVIGGLDLSRHRSRALRAQDLEAADHIFPMTAVQAICAATLLPEAAGRIRLLGAFAPATEQSRQPADPGNPVTMAIEIADPMGGDLDDFRDCYDRLWATTSACSNWLLAGADSGLAPATWELQAGRGNDTDNGR